MKIEEIRKDIERIRILDAPVDIVDNRTALAFVDRCVRAGAQAACIFAVNPEKICALRSDPALGQFFNSAALLLPDGIGIVGAARLLHGRRMHRAPGADLMQHICAVAPARGYRIFVLGATEHVNSAAVAALSRRHPGIRMSAGRTVTSRRKKTTALSKKLMSPLRTSFSWRSAAHARSTGWKPTSQS